MKKTVLAAAVAAASFSLAGCATVMNGTEQKYPIKSEPSGAKVVLSNGAECVTPCNLKLKRRNHLRVDFTREGYQPAYVLVRSKAGGATIGNVLAGGMIGVLVDSSNGSNNFLSPKPLDVKLAPVGSSETAMLLDEKGKDVGTVDAHNAEVREKVVETLGRKLAGYEEAPAAVAAPVAEAVVPTVAEAAVAPAAEAPAPTQ